MIEPYEIIKPFSEDTPMGKYGFLIKLDGEIAQRAYQFNFSRESYRKLQEEGKEISKRFSPSIIVKPTYNFVSPKTGPLHTGLLKFCGIPAKDPGLCADLLHMNQLISGEELKVLEYRTIAVDIDRQAKALEALWIHWFEEITTLSTK